MSQSDHTTNFRDYVIISLHIFLYFVSLAQFFAKLIRFDNLGHKIKNPKFDQNSLRIE